MNPNNEPHQYHLKMQKTGSSFEFSEGSDESSYERKEIELQEQLKSIQLLREQEAVRQREEEAMISKAEEIDYEVNELSQELHNAISFMDNELASNKSELEVLTLGRQNLVSQLERLSQVNPKMWSREEFNMEVDRAYVSISATEKQIEAVEHSLEGTRMADEKVYQAKVKSTGKGVGSSFIQGLAYNIPVSIAILALAYVVYIKL